MALTQVRTCAGTSWSGYFFGAYKFCGRELLAVRILIVFTASDLLAPSFFY